MAGACFERHQRAGHLAACAHQLWVEAVAHNCCESLNLDGGAAGRRAQKAAAELPIPPSSSIPQGLAQNGVTFPLSPSCVAHPSYPRSALRCLNQASTFQDHVSGMVRHNDHYAVGCLNI